MHDVKQQRDVKQVVFYDRARREDGWKTRALVKLEADIPAKIEKFGISL